jgi:hypothetical protein
MKRGSVWWFLGVNILAVAVTSGLEGMNMVSMRKLTYRALTYRAHDSLAADRTHDINEPGIG